LLRATNINAFYGSAHVLHDVDIEVAQGSRVALVGRNGAGKSTLLKSIMNAGPRVEGDVEFDGTVLGAMPAFRRVRKGLSFVPEDRRILTHITVFENLEIAARPVTDRKPHDPEAILNRFAMLVPLRDRPGGRLSGGQQQMLAVARALVARPKLMLLDEPTEGLAPVIVEQLAREIVATCVEADMGLLLCEQNLWFARHCTDYVYVIDSGQIVFKGSWRLFDEKTEIKTKYLSV
jgi:branched-chain amino acid transport system ATP-binding protein